jgi:hypothetical protein
MQDGIDITLPIDHFASGINPNELLGHAPHGKYGPLVIQQGKISQLFEMNNPIVHALVAT